MLLDIWQKTYWLRLHKGKSQAIDLGMSGISRFTCHLCGERRYYDCTGRFDKDVPQYHQVGKRWLTLCHACWHLKGIYKKHQKAASPEGLSGCRVCHLQLAAKRNNRNRDKGHRKEEDTSNSAGRREVEVSTSDWKPTRVRRRVGLSS